MNERNTVLVAILIVGGIFVFSGLGDYSGRYVSGNAECKYLTDTSINSPVSISYDADLNDGIPPNIIRSKCVGSTVLSNLECVDGATYNRYNIDCPRGQVCVNDPQGAYCKVGSTKQVSGKCTDSDDGANIYERGIVIVESGRGYSIPERMEDRCATDVSVFEATCASGGKDIEREVLQCPYPYKCSNGVCKLK